MEVWTRTLQLGIQRRRSSMTATVGKCVGRHDENCDNGRQNKSDRKGSCISHKLTSITRSLTSCC